MSKISLMSNTEIFHDKSRNKLIKSCSTGVNSLYGKYIDKIKPNKVNKNYKDNNLRKYNFSASKVNYKKNFSQTSFNSFNIDNKPLKKNSFHFHSFSKIIEKYFQQKNNELNKSNKNRSDKNFISESNIYYTSNKKSNLIFQNSKKNESYNINNKNKSSRNKNLSMREIDSNIKSLKHTHNNFRRDNIYPKKIFNLNTNIIIKKNNQEISPINKNNKNKSINFFNNNNSEIKNKKSRNKNNSMKKTDSNCSEVETENKYNILFNRNNKINNLNKGNFHTNENTKPNTLNTKFDELEGPEIIHFSLIDLIQRSKKKMEEISNNLNKENK